MPAKRGKSEYVISYLFLRKAIGIIGIALPVMLVTGKCLFESPGMQSSISAYYYTVMRDVFVGSLCAIAIFLMSYQGPEKADHLIGTLACIFALGVALFPCEPQHNPNQHEHMIGMVHYLFAALFFCMLAYFCLFLFCKTDTPDNPNPRKIIRNRVYKTCGYTIIGSIVMIVVVTQIFKNSPIHQFNPVFWLESSAIWAFGWSWFTKGDGIRFLRDI